MSSRPPPEQPAQVFPEASNVRRLEQLDELRKKRILLKKRLAQLDAYRDELIIECFQSGEIGATTLARVSGLTTNGVYKVRDRNLGAQFKRPTKKERSPQYPPHHPDGLPFRPVSA